MSVLLRVVDDLEFCFREVHNATGVQLDDHLEVVWLADSVFLVLDPLQARDYQQARWSLEQVRSSRWYVGGASLFWTLESSYAQGEGGELNPNRP